MKSFTLFLVSISWCWADANQIRQLLQSALSEPSPAALINHIEELSATSDLTPADVAALVPLAVQCLRSPTANEYGMTFLFGVTLRADALQVLERYLDQFDAIASGPGGRVRTSAFTILVMITPRWDSYGVDPKKPESERLAKSDFADAVARAAKVISILNNHLEDKTNSRDDVAGIAETLLRASTFDPAMIHKILTFAEKRSEVHVTIVVLNALGRAHNPEALDFIGKNLDSENRDVREQAIQTVGHLDREVRTAFVAKHAAQFGRLAVDPEIGPQFQTMARDALSSKEMIR